MRIQDAPERLRALPSFLLAQAALAGRRSVTRTFEGDGLHRSQFALLATVEEFGPLNQTELGARSGLDRSDVVRWVDDLVARGLLNRQPDPQDRRRNLISLTRTGQRRVAQLAERLESAQQEFLSGLTARERTQLESLLRRLIAAAEQE